VSRWRPSFSPRRPSLISIEKGPISSGALTGIATDVGEAPERLSRPFVLRRGCRIAAMLLRMKTHFVALQSRGTVALPADLRHKLHLDEPGAQLQIIEKDDGTVELHPVLPVAADQRWFWTERWQAMEREVDAHVAAGRVTVVDGPDGLFEHLARSLPS
jgi:bifunctional DNA-binding transcriptional regulator/antitoxin component of YhaV-PrlF toxin-antitoxin module